MGDLTAVDGSPISTVKKQTLILEYDPSQCKLSIGGELGNLDMALNILAQATRYIESRYRSQQAMLFRAEVEQDKKIVSMIHQ